MYLGHLKEVLGDVNDTAELLDALDPGLDGLGVVLTGSVQDILDLVALALGPLLVCWSSVVSDGPVDGQKREKNDRFLVDDVELVGDCGNGETGACGQDGRLGHQVAAGETIED